MLQTLLTVMVFIMPFLISQKEVARPGLHTGLWISLFFWGRIHAIFSILVFSISLLFYTLNTNSSHSLASETIGSIDNNHGESILAAPALWIPRSGTRPLIGFLAVLMVFCAFGNVCRDYGATLNLNATIRETALLLDLAGSLTGPIFFGLFSDKKGPFTAFMTLLALGLGAVAFAALSSDFPYLFPFGSLTMQAVIGGIFTLMPHLLLRFYGRAQLSFILPFLLIFLTALWTASLRFYDGADALPQDYLLCMLFLLVMAAPLAASAWHRRLTVL